LKGFKDNGPWQTREYYYNENGKMLADENNHIESVAYNYLNLPQQVE
jgi:hypothetical protein